MDPDEQVQQVVRLVFRKFEELGTLHALLRYLVSNGIHLGVRVREGEGKGELGVAQAQPHDLAEHAQKPHLRRGLRLRQEAGRSPQETSGEALHRPRGARQGAVARFHRRELPGLHLPGAIRARNFGASGRQPCSCRGAGRGAPRPLTAAGAAYLRQVRPPDAGALRRPQKAAHLHLQPHGHRLRRKLLPLSARRLCGRVRRQDGS